jgi:hypothetical protein
MISLFKVLGRLRRLKKVVHTGGTQDPIRGFRNPYTIGFSAILRSLAESPSLSANSFSPIYRIKPGHSGRFLSVAPQSDVCL